ncbi:MAG: tRNA preQ1(34) S-adenosylmethionine ribosyltransferase-isomerase QueA [Proteobacteria bacterium]|nr:tRNA preQ1(34) S-adenosylmethionine ribosyltransferase-isomerase QueA [Pseudomonadota bacterium]
MSLFRSTYSYDLPDDLIADKPVEPRDASRMLMLNRETGAIQHRRFAEFPSFLEKDSILVVNNSRVIPARLPGQRRTGGSVEILLVQEEEPGLWLCKVKNSARLKSGEILKLCDGLLQAEFLDKTDSGDCILRFSNPETLFRSLEEFAFAPLPPYIHKVREKAVDRSEDLKNYQTIFAREYGAIAAPTAGLHFTPEVVAELERKNVEILEITLHVGLGTFEPIRAEDIRQHQMHEEEYHIPERAADALNDARKRGRKIVAVGTTATRTLESACRKGEIAVGRGKTDLFIYPSYTFKVVDQLLTNFHLPESTLLMLVSAFTSQEPVMLAYREAVRRKYRFYSYGDCMFVH